MRQDSELTHVQIIIGGVVNGHVACKYIYVRIFRKTDRMHKNDFVAVGSWALILFVTWVIAWVIASAIPVFNNLLSLIVCLSLLSLFSSPCSDHGLGR
jgi:hypothetical protein